MQKVVIIEDDESTNNHLRNLISGYEIEIAQAFRRDEAIGLLEKGSFDVAIVDVDLGPGPKEKYAGFEILSALANTRTVTLVVSGAPHSNIHDVAISLQAYDFIQKPIHELSFINKFEHALDTSRGKEADAVPTDGNLPPNLTKDPKLQFALRWKNLPVRLTITQLRLVTCLVERPGVPVKRDKLSLQLGQATSAAALATHMSEIRKSFLDVDEHFNHIQSEPGVGYVWKIDA